MLNTLRVLIRRHTALLNIATLTHPSVLHSMGIIFYIYIYSTILLEGDRLTFTIEIALCRSGMIGTNYNEGYKILY